MPALRVVILLSVITLLTRPNLTSADDLGSDPSGADKPTLAEQIRGEWVCYRDTPQGRFMTIKHHLEDQTVVTTYDPNNTPLQSHRSEYRIESSGSVSIFRYRNKVVLIGPNVGAKDERESAYLFRIEGDRFIEVRGMLNEDRGEPSLIIWKRLKENPIPKPKA